MNKKPQIATITTQEKKIFVKGKDLSIEIDYDTFTALHIREYDHPDRIKIDDAALEASGEGKKPIAQIDWDKFRYSDPNFENIFLVDIETPEICLEIMTRREDADKIGIIYEERMRKILADATDHKGRKIKFAKSKSKKPSYPLYFRACGFCCDDDDEDFSQAT